jgi:hypothetical protein
MKWLLQSGEPNETHASLRSRTSPISGRGLREENISSARGRRGVFHAVQLFVVERTKMKLPLTTI